MKNSLTSCGLFSHFLCPPWCFVTFWNVWSYFHIISFHRTWKIRATGGFPSVGVSPQSSLRRVAGFFCNGEIGAPGLTKPSDDLAEREQVRERRWMDGFGWVNLETKKMVKLRKVEVNVCWKKGVASDLSIAYIYVYVFSCKYIRGGGFGFNQDVGWFYTCKSGWVGTCWVDTAWVKTAWTDEVRPMSLHGFTAVFALLGDGSLCVMERCTKDFLPVKV